jgi:hypothetical protein
MSPTVDAAKVNNDVMHTQQMDQKDDTQTVGTIIKIKVDQLLRLYYCLPVIFYSTQHSSLCT